ncbi:MAG: hypothetical protein KKF89_03810 [Nanoarchaeota archaeon]|nr:hypothetical protein [Nanoarchaeota archaeon]MBU1854822.1 hypothetical protein [Nanoarchaeota archaeon]
MNDVLETLDELGFGEASYLDNLELQKRVKETIARFGHKISIPLQYIIEGGLRDSREFQNGYQDKEKPEKHKKQVREAMTQIAMNQNLNFVYCPFMKNRALKCVQSELISPQVIRTALCYVLQGTEDFSRTQESENEKREYLTSIGILDK